MRFSLSLRFSLNQPYSNTCTEVIKNQYDFQHIMGKRKTRISYIRKKKPRDHTLKCSIAYHGGIEFLHLTCCLTEKLYPTSLSDLLKWWYPCKFKQVKKLNSEAMPMAILWILWKTRNRLILLK